MFDFLRTHGFNLHRGLSTSLRKRMEGERSMRNLVSRTFVLLAVLLVSNSSFAAVSNQGAESGKYFDRVIYVVFENTNYQKALQQPFFKSLADGGALFSQFNAETHPSQGNYIAMTAGSLHNVKSNQNVNLDVSHIGDLLEARGLTWKVYAEQYPGKCYTGGSYKGYARKHNPFISFLNVQKNPARCANIVPAEEFDKDRARGTLPNYVFYVPDVKNDGHDTGVAFADKWYKGKFAPVLADTEFMKRTLLISTFDESGGGRGNLIYTSLFGPMIRPATVVNEKMNFFSLLKLLEENWTLGNLGKEDVSAPAVPNIWK